MFLDLAVALGEDAQGRPGDAFAFAPGWPGDSLAFEPVARVATPASWQQCARDAGRGWPHAEVLSTNGRATLARMLSSAVRWIA